MVTGLGDRGRLHKGGKDADTWKTWTARANRTLPARSERTQRILPAHRAGPDPRNKLLGHYAHFEALFVIEGFAWGATQERLFAHSR